MILASLESNRMQKHQEKKNDFLLFLVFVFAGLEKSSVCRGGAGDEAGCRSGVSTSGASAHSSHSHPGEGCM